MFRYTFIMGFLLILSQGSFADCQDVNIFDRYECMRKKSAAEPAKKEWKYIEKTDPITDEVQMSMGIEAKTVDGSHKPVHLVIRCVGGKTKFLIIWRVKIGPDPVVISRIGESKPEEQEWVPSKNYEASFYPRKPVKENILEGMLVGERLPKIHANELSTAKKYAARVETVKGEEVTAVWKLKDVKEVSRPLAEACDW